MAWDLDHHPNGVSYHIEGAAEDVSFYTPTIQVAASMWSSVADSRLYLSLLPLSGSITIRLEAANQGDFTAGYALFDQIDTISGEPIHCLAVVEVQTSSLSTAKTILHEIGHCLGLGHSMVPDSIMSYQVESNSFALSIDDEAALSRLYPANGDKPQLPPGCAIGVKSSTPIQGWSWLFLIPLVFAYLKRDKTISG